MRRIVTAALSTITVMVLLFSYHTSTNAGSAAQAPAYAGPAQAASSRPATGAAPPRPAPAEHSPAAAAKPAPAPVPAPAPAPVSSAAYTGDVADTRWGPVQVQIAVAGGKITASRAVQYPQGTNQDAQINNYALPILDSEAVQKQNASIDTVSGATVTSDGYLTSLQSAIDQAHL